MKVKSSEIKIKWNETKVKWNEIKIKIKFSTQPRAATTSMHCVHHVDFVFCLHLFLSKKQSKMVDNRFSSCKEDRLLKATMQMYVKQGLKRKKSTSSSRLRPCLTNICIAALRRWSSLHEENLLSAILELLRVKES